MKLPREIWVVPKNFKLPGGAKAQGYRLAVTSNWLQKIVDELEVLQFGSNGAVDYIEVHWHEPETGADFPMSAKFYPHL